MVLKYHQAASALASGFFQLSRQPCLLLLRLFGDLSRRRNYARVEHKSREFVHAESVIVVVEEFAIGRQAGGSWLVAHIVIARNVEETDARIEFRGDTQILGSLGGVARLVDEIA